MQRYRENIKVPLKRTCAYQEQWTQMNERICKLDALITSRRNASETAISRRRYNCRAAAVKEFYYPRHREL